MELNIFGTITPILIAILFSYSNYVLLQKIKSDNTLINFIFAFSVSPFLFSLALYGLIYFFPQRTNYWYILWISLPALVYSFIILIKNKISFKHTFKLSNLSTRSKILLGLLLFIITLTGIRTIFWPINWDDQILYVKQAYSVGEAKDIGFYLNPQAFTSSGTGYFVDPVIRPGLFMLYTFFYEFTSSYQILPTVAQVIIFYYFLLLLLTVYAVTLRLTHDPNKGVLAVFLLSTCYYFINFTIYGFKEVAICALLLLAINQIIDIKRKNNPILDSILLGLLLGLLSFINYSGTVIDCILLLCLFIFSPGDIVNKIKYCLISGVIAILTCGNEIYVFYLWLLGGFVGVKSLISFGGNIFGQLATSISTTGLAGGISEFTGYKIGSAFDIYIKGKFQGIFQVQFFGFIIPTFLVVFFSRIRYFLKQKELRLYIFFVIVYFFIFFDPLSSNRNEYAYILAISPKYTLILIPIFAVLLSTQLDWLSKIFQKITPKHLIFLLLATVPISIFLFANNSNIAFSYIQKLVPLYRSNDYYINLLNFLFKLLIILILISLASIAGGYFIFKNKFKTIWRKNGFSMTIFFITFFFVPFLFFFNSNYGISDILTKSFLTTNQKLVDIKGSEQINQLITYVNVNFPQDSILLVDGYSTSTIFHINKSPSLLHYLPPLVCISLQNYLKANKISLIFANSYSAINGIKIIDTPNIKPIFRANDVILFEVVKP